MPLFHFQIFVWMCISASQAFAEPAWNKAFHAEIAILHLRSATVTLPPVESVVPVELRKASSSPLNQNAKQGSVVDSVEVSAIKLLSPASLNEEVVSELSRITSAFKSQPNSSDKTSGISSGTYVLIPDSKESDLAWVIE